MELIDFGGGAEFAAIGILGGPGSGKTHTSAKILGGVIRDKGLPGDVYCFDSEGGIDYVREVLQEAAGRPIKVRGVRSRSFKDMCDLMKQAIKDQVPAVLIDSGTHAHRELTEGYLAQVNKQRARKGLSERPNLTIRDFGMIARLWEPFSELFVNAPMHKVLCGRAGLVYSEEKDEETGEKKLQVVDLKMKIQGEFGFEPSLVLQMSRYMEVDAGRKRVKCVERRALVLKDRFGVIDGKDFVNPTYEDFRPFFDRLGGGVHQPIDVTVKTAPAVDIGGRDDFDREKKAREILIEEIKGELTARYPGAVGKDAAQKFEYLYRHLGTRSWAALEGFASDRLRSALQSIRVELGVKPSDNAAAAAEGDDVTHE